MKTVGYEILQVEWKFLGPVHVERFSGFIETQISSSLLFSNDLDKKIG